MNDHPIIFSAPMVNSLLSGSKTMTRRLAWRDGQIVEERDRARLGRKGHRFERHGGDCFSFPPSAWQRVRPGDRLWVREGWRAHSIYDAVKPRQLPQSRVWYLADVGYQPKSKGRAPIFLPRWASRITLIVTATKIERVQKISNSDAIAEGCGVNFDHDHPERTRETFPAERFRDLWIRLHGTESWDANPEVVVLTFTVHKTNIDARTPPTPIRGGIMPLPDLYTRLT